jgi:hypothetical protein
MIENNSLTASAKLIETCFESEHYAALFSGESTHDPALRFIGQILRHTQDEALILRVIASGLPESYKENSSAKTKNTLQEVPGMIKDAISKGFHETGIETKKSKNVDVLVAMVRERKGTELFHDALKRAYIGYKDEGKGLVVRRLASGSAKMWLRGFLYEQTGRAIPQQEFSSFMETLQAIALYEGPLKAVLLRIAHEGGRVVVDLANDSRRLSPEHGFPGCLLQLAGYAGNSRPTGAGQRPQGASGPLGLKR